MNRSALFNQSWSIMIRNPSMWAVAFIGLGIGTIGNLLLASPDLGAAAVNMIVGFITTAFTTAALISMVNSAAENRSVSVNDGIQVGLQRMPRLMAIQLLLIIPTWIVLFLVTGSFLSVFTSVLGQPNGIQATNIVSLAGSLLGFVGLIIVISIITGVISIGADRSVVLEDRSVFDALKRGWNLFASHLPDFVAIGLMMLVVALGIAILFGCTIGALLTSATASQLNVLESGNVAALTSNPTYLVSVLIGLLIGVLTEILFSGVWTLAFRHWQGK